VTVIASGQVKVLAESIGADKWVIYQIRGVTSGDTFDASAKFGKVVAATFIDAQGAVFTAGVISSNTVITLTLGGLAADTVLLLVKGDSF
jgi:hypothetical protein